QPNAHLAFGSIQYIMRDVHWGWLIRYMHTTGASLFFVVIYLHMFRGLLYGSYKKPRELLWILGMLIYVCLMAEAFMGYLMPWGQMSYVGRGGHYLAFWCDPVGRQSPGDLGPW
ncbi:membrane protein containing Cytochrome b/b6, partial [mine drainage metagenome]